MKKYQGWMKSKLSKGVAAIGGVLASAQTFALDEAGNTAIGAAYTAGETSVGLTTSGMIGLVAICVGVSLIVMLLKKA